jgi:hypothetical protein
MMEYITLDNDISPMVIVALSYSLAGEVLLQHHRLGHMPFTTMGQLYPGLFNIALTMVHSM